MKLKHLKLNVPILLFIVIVILTLIAWNNRFAFDDAFISFRYAEHLAQGHGLVWNIGEAPLEGYTNFLWTLLMSSAFVLSIDPELFSWIISMACFVGSLLGVYFLAGDSAYLVYRTHISTIPSKLVLLMTSILFAFALMTRLDSAIVVGVLGLACLNTIAYSQTDTRYKIISTIAISLPTLLMVGGWLLWKLSYYGDILPNTFYAKADTNFLAIVLKRGSFYLIGFWLSYWLFPFLVLIVYRIFKRKIHSFEVIPFIILLIWTLYLFYIGGDFMEYRFMVPVLPLLMVLIVATIAQYKNIYLQAGLILIVIGGSIFHAMTFKLVASDMRMHHIDGMRNVQSHLYSDWDDIGKVLGEAFNYDRTITIATTPAGLIPYYSKLRTIDMLGLNDAWIARNGVPHLVQAGHERISPFAYLREQGMNLLIDHPKLITNNELHEFSSELLDEFHVPLSLDDLPKHSVFLVIPINTDYDLLTIYVEPHPTIDEAIDTYGWATYPILDIDT